MEFVTRQSLPKTSVVRVSKRGLSDIESNTTVASHLRQNLQRRINRRGWTNRAVDDDSDGIDGRVAVMI